MKHTRSIILLLVTVLSGGGAWSAEVYTWTDAQGMVHITDRPPPPGVQVKAVDKDKRPVVETFTSERRPTPAASTAAEKIKESDAALVNLQEMAEKVSEAQTAYEAAVEAVEAEQAKYAYSAKRRRAPRQTVIELDETAKAAFSEYRRLLNEYKQAELKAREADQRANAAIEAIGATPPESPPPDETPRNN